MVEEKEYVITWYELTHPNKTAMEIQDAICVEVDNMCPIYNSNGNSITVKIDLELDKK